MKPFLLCIACSLLTHVLSAQGFSDIIIDEIMADPSPQVGLPGNEWIELKNTSGAAINLQGWRIGDSGGQSGPLPSFQLAPDSFVIICTGSAVTAMSSFGATLAVTSFPSLDNDGEIIFLRNPAGKTFHSVNYSSAWYKNDIKKEGGWSLEMIDTQNPCTGINNWKASNHNNGGTPGRVNSVNGINADREPPGIKNAFASDDKTIILVFDEPVDSTSGALVTHYKIDRGNQFLSAETVSPSFSSVKLTLVNSLLTDSVYLLTAEGTGDCKNNPITTPVTVKTGLASDAATGDLVINEILFNPRPNANDYVEFLHTGKKILDASRLLIANRNSSGAISSSQRLSPTPFLFFPGDYLVVTTDADNLGLNYLVSKPESVLTLPALPSFPDDKGTVVMLNQQTGIIDEVSYSKDWHFKLIDDAEGVSLERVNPEGHSQQKDNWHSAASTAGFGTPGYKNSQLRNLSAISATIEIIPKVFSPDNDGFDDLASIQYRMDQPGYVANVTIYDAAGRPIRNLVRNGTLSSSGSWNWDGLDDKGLRLPLGTYIIFTEVFNLQGRKERFKNVVVLGRRMN